MATGSCRGNSHLCSPLLPLLYRAGEGEMREEEGAR